ncbi:MAG: DUF983 domain-containing protein [Alphaproteobacteria bacterium]
MSMSVPDAPRPLLTSIRRGLAGRCPACGQGRVLAGYLKPVAACSHCGTPLGEIMTHDIAPYFTILVVGHIVVPLCLLVEQLYHPEMWVHLALWPTLTLGLTGLLLPRIKCGAMGLMWSLGLKGDETQ